MVADQAVSRRQVSSKDLSWRLSKWQTVAEHLEAQQYEQAAHILQGLQSTIGQSGNVGLTTILAAAHQICLACNQNQKDIAAHQRSLALAVARQQEIQQQLWSILNLVDERKRSQLNSTQTIPSSTGNSNQWGRWVVALWPKCLLAC
jgi:hypothetical protein